MGKRLALLVSSLAMASMLIQPHLSINARVLPSEPESIQAMQQVATLSDRVTVRAAGRGNPWINLKDGHSLLTDYAGTESLVQAMKRNQARPLALAADDFNEDVMNDLVCGYAGPTGGILTLHRGNMDAIYRNTNSPFLSPATVTDLPGVPDFLSTGDFNGDGHRDVLAAASGGDVLYVLPGDGRGNLGSPELFKLPARVTALTVGEINHGVGLTSVAVGVTGPDGPRVLLFDGTRGGLRNQATVFGLPTESTSLILGRLDGDHMLDLAVAAGRELLIVMGKDRRLSLDDVPEAKRQPVPPSRRTFSSAITSMTLGDFVRGERHGGELALLTQNGTVQVLTEAKGKTLGQWRSDLLVSGAWPLTTRLVTARVSSLPTDDLLVMDPKNHQVHILTTGEGQRTKNQGEQPPVSLDTQDAAVAVVPLRLNADALSDLVILKRGSMQPTVALTAPLATVTVDSTTDVADGDTSSMSSLTADPGPDGVISLREAITAANNTPGMDMIEFNIPDATDPGCDPDTGVCTIRPESSLPVITDPVTISGIPQSASSFSQSSFSLLQATSSTLTLSRMMDSGVQPCMIELNGEIAGGTGLDVNTWDCGMNGMQMTGWPEAATRIREAGMSNTIQYNVLGGEFSVLGGKGGGNGEGVVVFGPKNFINYNLISNNGDGWSIIGDKAKGNECMKNLVWGNEGAGGGFAFGAPDNIAKWNVFHSNCIFGAIVFSDANGTTFGTNSIHGNGPLMCGFGDGAISSLVQQNDVHLGIDLEADGVTRNDRGDGDRGANNRQNFPVLTAATQTNGPTIASSTQSSGTTIQGKLNSKRNTAYMVEIFANTECDPSGFGEGQFPIGSTMVTTDRRGNGDFEVTLPLIVPAGNVITATATDPEGNTSEFSECVPVMGTAQPEVVLIKSGPESISCDEPITYEVTARNDGGATALAAILVDALPDCLTNIECETTEGVCFSLGNTVVAVLGALDPGASAMITITATVNPDCAPSISNTATLTVPSDSNEANNSSTITTSVNCSP